MSGEASRRREDLALVAQLLDGDEESFRALVEATNPQMLRLARMDGPSAALAEEAVPEAWVGIIKGLPRFEGRSTPTRPAPTASDTEPSRRGRGVECRA